MNIYYVVKIAEDCGKSLENTEDFRRICEQ